MVVGLASLLLGFELLAACVGLLSVVLGFDLLVVFVVLLLLVLSVDVFVVFFGLLLPLFGFICQLRLSVCCHSSWVLFCWLWVVGFCCHASCFFLCVVGLLSLLVLIRWLCL